jgi:ketosteroid isomerase-like protein
VRVDDPEQRHRLFAERLSAGDLALLSNSWSIAFGEDPVPQEGPHGRSAEVARRQPDGGWLHAIEDPAASVLAEL